MDEFLQSALRPQRELEPPAAIADREIAAPQQMPLEMVERSRLDRVQLAITAIKERRDELVQVPQIIFLCMLST